MKQIETPIGKRNVPSEVYELFESMPLKPTEERPDKYKVGDRTYEWVIENDKLITKTYVT